MTSRERVRAVLNHQLPDRLPVDFGSTHNTGIHAYALDALRKKLGIDRQVHVYDPMHMLGTVEEEERKIIGSDVIGLENPFSVLNFRSRGKKPWVTPSGLEVTVSEEFVYSKDEKGNLYAYPQGDCTVPPAAKMTPRQPYFDNIIRQLPYDEDNMDGRKDYGEDKFLYSDFELRYFEDNAKNYYDNTEYAIIGSNYPLCIGCPFHLPGAGNKHPEGIRNYEDWYAAYYEHPDYVKDSFDAQADRALENIKLLYQAVGNRLEAVVISGTDFGSQNGPVLSPDTYREFHGPRYRRINDWIHQNTTWKTWYHSCGSTISLLDDFINDGIDVVNPVQLTARGMDPNVLKQKYGEKLVFWGGAVDSQGTLPKKSPEEVFREATENAKILSQGGGYVFANVHNVLPDVPPENILALFEAAKQFTY